MQTYIELLMIRCPDPGRLHQGKSAKRGTCSLLMAPLPTLRDGNYLIFKDAPKIETIKAGLKYIDINVLRRFSVILHCNGISSHFNIRRSLSSDSYINKSTAKHFTNLGRETFVYLLSPNLSISQGT